MPQDNRTKKLIAVFLIAVAGIALLYVIKALLQLWNTPEQVGLAKYFIDLTNDYMVLKTPKGDVELPPITPIVTGIFLCICVLSGFLSLIKLFITLGFGLLFPEGYADLNSLKSDINKLKQKLEQ